MSRVPFVLLLHPVLQRPCFHFSIGRDRADAAARVVTGAVAHCLSVQWDEEEPDLGPEAGAEEAPDPTNMVEVPLCADSELDAVRLVARLTGEPVEEIAVHWRTVFVPPAGPDPLRDLVDGALSSIDGTLARDGAPSEVRTRRLALAQRLFLGAGPAFGVGVPRRYWMTLEPDTMLVALRPEDLEANERILQADVMDPTDGKVDDDDEDLPPAAKRTYTPLAFEAPDEMTAFRYFTAVADLREDFSAHCFRLQIPWDGSGVDPLAPLLEEHVRREAEDAQRQAKEAQGVAPSASRVSAVERPPELHPRHAGQSAREIADLIAADVEALWAMKPSYVCALSTLLGGGAEQLLHPEDESTLDVEAAVAK